MREKDVTAKEYLENENRIADLINVAYHGGQQVVRPEHVHTRKCRSVIKKRKNSKRESNEITKDIASRIDIQMKTVNISIEVQTEVHYAMPLRVLGGEYAEYQEQWRKIKEKHKNEKDLRNAQYSGSWKKLEEYKNDLYREEGEVDMCKAIDDLIAKGEKRGYDNGYGSGNVQGILFMVKKMGLEKSEALGNLMEGMNITKEKAEEYVNLYW